MKLNSTTWLMLATIAVLVLAWRAARAQAVQSKLVTIGAASDFSISVYHDPPNDNKLLSTIVAAEAEPLLASGKFRLKKLKLEAFGLSGSRELIVEAPDCLYDSVNQTASSPGPLHVDYGDGTLVLEGEGFLWEQKTQLLMISNRVHTTISGLKPDKNKS